MNIYSFIAAAWKNLNKPGIRAIFRLVAHKMRFIWFLILSLGAFYSWGPPGPFLAAQNQAFSSLSGTFWFDLGLNLSSQTYNPEAPDSPKEQLENLIESSQRFVQSEASYVFYGMIYGYQAVYRPPGRNQKEYFVLTLQAPERIGVEEMDIYHISNFGHRYYYSIRKPLSPFESAAVGAWRQGDRKSFQVTGAALFSSPPLASIKAPGNGGEPDAQKDAPRDGEGDLRPARLIGLRKTALENAIKEGIRNYFRGKLRNKPAEIKIELALSDVPQIFIDSGRVLATVRLYFGHYTVKNYAMR